MSPHALILRHLGIDTQREHTIYMRRDCHVCRSEGFAAQARVLVRANGGSLLATLHVVDAALLAPGEAALSVGAERALGAGAGDAVAVTHAPQLDSLGAMRAKIFGRALTDDMLASVMRDIAEDRYTDVQIAAFLSACAGGRMSRRETIGLTAAMVAAGERLHWAHAPIADKHCVGGLPGNRTTPIVVAIAAAAGLTIPKTSSRAITSPAGTADVVETITRVDLDLATMRRVVDRTGGCLAWGGALALSPADDVLVRVERALDLDSDAQLVASVLSKKIAAGASHVLIDVPVGPTAKVRTPADAATLEALLHHAAAAFDLRLAVLRTDGLEPVGRGIGPALEARDVLAVLRGERDAPADLRERALDLAGALLELCGHASAQHGRAAAEQLLRSGAAWGTFQAICEAQGRLSEPGTASIRRPIEADRDGVVTELDNRRLARVAKLAGAPAVPRAGLELHVRRGHRVARGMPLFTVHADSPGELDYALEYHHGHPAITIEDSPSAGGLR